MIRVESADGVLIVPFQYSIVMLWKGLLVCGGILKDMLWLWLLE